jgi:hypothetical protein
MFFVHQKLVRCAAIENGWAWLQHIDLDGNVQISSAPASSLIPVRDFFMPRTAWAAAGHLDQVIAEEEERAAAAARAAKKRAARKARRSMKIKRTT